MNEPVSPPPGGSPSREELGRWLVERLTSEHARADYGRVLEAAHEQLLATRLDEVLPPAAVMRLVESDLEPERLVSLVRPFARAGLKDTVERMRKDQRPVGRLVPAEAKAALERMVSRAGFVHPELIRSVFREEAVEAVLRDTLARVLREFSTVIPRLITGFMAKSRLPMFGTAGVLGGKIVEEIERLIEPEIRSFLAGGTRIALERAADYAVAHLDDPASLELRRNVLRFLLGKPPSWHALALNDGAMTDIDAAAEAIARHVAGLDEVKKEIRELVEELAKAHGAKPVKEVLDSLGATTRLDMRAVAEATWPAVVQGMKAKVIEEWLGEVALELLAKFAPPAAPGPD